MHTTRQIADRLEVNPQTIRRWADQYREYMSAESRRADTRQYTDDDLLLLWSVKRWRALGYSLDEIDNRLSNGERTTDPPPEVQAGDDQPRRAVMVSEAAHTAALAEIRRLEADRERLVIERDRAVQQQHEVVSDLNSQLRTLERKLGELRGKLTTLEQTHRPADYWLRRGLLVVLGAVVLTVVIVGVVLVLAGQG